MCCVPACVPVCAYGPVHMYVLVCPYCVPAWTFVCYVHECVPVYESVPVNACVPLYIVYLGIYLYSLCTCMYTCV